MNKKINVYKILGTTKTAIKKDYNDFCNDTGSDKKSRFNKLYYISLVLKHKVEMDGISSLQGYEPNILESILLNDL